MSEGQDLSDSEEYEIPREVEEFRRWMMSHPTPPLKRSQRPEPPTGPCGAKGPEDAVCVREAGHRYRGEWRMQPDLQHRDALGRLFTSKSRSGRTPAKFHEFGESEHYTEADYQTWLRL